MSALTPTNSARSPFLHFRAQPKTPRFLPAAAEMPGFPRLLDMPSCLLVMPACQAVARTISFIYKSISAQNAHCRN
eukprot:scaffold261276_cov19-Tisochrysis_lutea.AAC.1